MNIVLRVQSDEVPVDVLHQKVVSIRNDLRKLLGVHADLVSETTDRSVRGDILAVGAILLPILNSEAVVALLDLVKSYIQRDKKMEITVEKDNQKISINIENMGHKKIVESLGAIFGTAEP